MLVYCMHSCTLYNRILFFVREPGNSREWWRHSYSCARSDHVLHILQVPWIPEPTKYRILSCHVQISTWKTPNCMRQLHLAYDCKFLIWIPVRNTPHVQWVTYFRISKSPQYFCLQILFTNQLPVFGCRRPTDGASWWAKTFISISPGIRQFMYQRLPSVMLSNYYSLYFKWLSDPLKIEMSNSSVLAYFKLGILNNNTVTEVPHHQASKIMRYL
jgi:hypothetical protein